MCRSYRDIGHPHQGIGTGGVYTQGRAIGQGEIKVHTFRAANPVALHGAHLLRPLVQFVQVIEQLVGVSGDLDKPLVNFPALYGIVTAPAAAVHHLLVGQHGLVGLAPVHLGLFLVGQALLEQAGKEPLLPAVVGGVTGGQFAVPVVGKAQFAQLLAHVIDVLGRPLRRWHIVLDGGIFCRQAKGVPAHGLQHVLALHALVAGDDIGNGVVAYVAHMQFAAGVGEHGQTVEFLPLVVLLHGEAVVLQPVLLCGLFQGLGVIVLIYHGMRAASLNSGGIRAAITVGGGLQAGRKEARILSAIGGGCDVCRG